MVAALKRAGRRDLVFVGYDRMEPTVNGLINGTLTLLIAHPLQRLAAECLAALRDCAENPGRRPGDRLVVFEVLTAENL